MRLQALTRAFALNWWLVIGMVTLFGLSHQFPHAGQLGKLFSPFLAVGFPYRVILLLARSTHDPTFDRRH
jgi:hypothetical protein